MPRLCCHLAAADASADGSFPYVQMDLGNHILHLRPLPQLRGLAILLEHPLRMMMAPLPFLTTKIDELKPVARLSQLVERSLIDMKHRFTSMQAEWVDATAPLRSLLDRLDGKFEHVDGTVAHKRTPRVRCRWRSLCPTCTRCVAQRRVRFRLCATSARGRAAMLSSKPVLVQSVVVGCVDERLQNFFSNDVSIAVCPRVRRTSQRSTPECLVADDAFSVAPCVLIAPPSQRVGVAALGRQHQQMFVRPPAQRRALPASVDGSKRGPSGRAAGLGGHTVRCPAQRDDAQRGDWRVLMRTRSVDAFAHGRAAIPGTSCPAKPRRPDWNPQRFTQP